MSLPRHSLEAPQVLTQIPFPLQLAYHPPNAWFKIVQQSLIMTNLPAPLHYLNYRVMMGQANLPIFRNQIAIKTSALDTATLMCSVSPHMVAQFAHYSMRHDCILKDDYYQFGESNRLSGKLPEFHLTRDDSELSVDLKISTFPILSSFLKLKLGLYEHWSLLCHCKGQIKYKGKVFNVDQQGSFEYTRAINVPYLPLCFYTYQIIDLKDQRQLQLIHLRNQFNQILQSKIFLKDFTQNKTECFETGVHFMVHRVYPKVSTPNHQSMYLAREFEWQWSNGAQHIRVYAQSRGDFKFGIGVGYAGSFNYQVEINEYLEEGSAGYCEYIDCRPLKWQERNSHEKLLEKLEHPFPVVLKK